MRRRVLTAILSVTAVAIVLFAVPLAVVVRQLVDEDAALRVEREAVLAAREVPADFATSDDPVELPESADAITLGLYSPDGRLVAGAGPEPVEEAVLGALGNRVVEARLDDARLVAVPVASDEQVIGVIRAAQPTSESDARSRTILGVLAASAVGVLAVGAVIGSLLAGRLATPVRRLRDAAVDLGQGRFGVEVPPSRIPELDEAAAAMTVTGRRLEDLLARERSFSDDASHQLRTPVAGLRAALETELAFPREDRTVVLREALEDVDRLELTITELLSIARVPQAGDATVDLADLVADVAPAWRRRLEGEGRHLALALPDGLPAVHGDPAMVRHVLDVLLDNALRHGAGEVRVSATIDADEVTVSVGDGGPGFTDRDGEPTATPGTDGRPHGLGLPLARRYAEAMGGRLVLPAEPPAHVDVVLRRVDA
ncbi:ATP-binding protein [Oryzobacter telluris]|uniref:sensor histidine kinase n=1 Tax=Oryzobacter telluris TaxID=3149179 RepID=UPI00370D41E9